MLLSISDMMAFSTNLQMFKVPCWMPQIQKLYRAQCRGDEQAHRVAALKELHKVLCEGGSATASTIQGLLPELWPQMLGLLGDTNADVRQTAAPVIGVLGALATKQGARPGKPPTACVLVLQRRKDAHAIQR